MPSTPRSAARLIGLAALLAFGGSARAARLGVPPAPGVDPPGYFVLTAPDAVNSTVNLALGDVAHFVTLYIESPQRGLLVDLHDPGLFDPALGAAQLDLNLGAAPTPPAGMRFTLFGPDGTGAMDALLADRTFGADTAATDRQLVNLFNDNRAPPGLYHLVCRVVDGAANEQDVSVFGVSVPGCTTYALGLTVGQANEGGATIAEPLRVFPHVVRPSAGSDAMGPVCGLQFTTFDLDAALNGDEPPLAQLTTKNGFAFPTSGASGDARWWLTDLGGVNPGDLDSGDHGPWSWEFSGLTMPEDCFGNLTPSHDFNAFAVQVLDYGAADRDFTTWADLPSSPPFVVFNPDGPRRIYLPDDADARPAKESLNHVATVTSGYPVPSLGEMSSLEVVLTLDNPTSYPLTGVVGRTHVASSPDVTAPTLVSSSGGLTATINGADPRRIDFTGDVAPGTTGEVRYRVDLLPSALGLAFLTGDGADYLGAGAPTAVTYDTPFTNPLSSELPQEAQGPICQLAYTAVLPACSVRAQLDASTLRTCPGTPVQLDASASEVFACAGGVAAYQWSVNGSIIDPFPAAATRTVSPLFNDTWEVRVACSTDPDNCFDTASVTFDLYPAPVVDAGADVAACAGQSVNLAAALGGGSPPYSNGRWSTDPPGESGDGATATTVTVTPSQDTTYTFTTDDAQGCTGADSVLVDVRTPLPGLSPDPPAVCPGATVALSALPGFASYSWSTAPPGASGDGSTAATVTVDQVGVAYTVTVTDDIGCSGQQTVTSVAAPPLTPAIAPASPELCPGGTVTLTAESGFASYAWDTAGADPPVDGATSQQVVASVVGATYTVTVRDATGCTGSASVTTAASPDPVPGPMNWSLRVARAGAADVSLTWLDLTDPAGAYQAVAFGCADANADGRCDADPTQANMAASGATSNVPVGTQQWTDAGVAGRAPRLVFYKVRALSPCSLTPGGFAVEP